MKKLSIMVLIFVILHFIIFAGATSRLNNGRIDIIYSGPIAHFMAFFTITLSTSLIFSNKLVKIRNPLVYSFLYALFLSFIIETIQKYLGFRTFSEKDILVGALGSLSYLILGKIASYTKAGNKIIEFATS